MALMNSDIPRRRSPEGQRSSAAKFLKLALAAAISGVAVVRAVRSATESGCSTVSEGETNGPSSPGANEAAVADIRPSQRERGIQRWVPLALAGGGLALYAVGAVRTAGELRESHVSVADTFRLVPLE